MRRQFLRVYVGIAVVLLLAALTTLFIVDWQVRKVVERRMEETMAPWVWRLRQRLLQAGDDSGQRNRMLERMNDAAPFAIRLVPLDETGLSAGEQEDLVASGTVLARTDAGLLLYASFDEDEALVLGPLQRRQLSARNGPGRWGPWSRQRPEEIPAPRGGPGRRGPWSRPLPEEPLSPFRELPYLLFGALLAILLVIGAAVYLLLQPFERRIYALADVARTFGEGSLDSRAPTGENDAIGALARAFNQMAERIERFIGHQKELLRAVSHELRTPLARLFFLLDDAQDAPDPERKNQVLGKIEGSLQELNDLVEELLTFVRLDREAEHPARETVAAGPVLADVAAVIADLRSGLEIEVLGDATVSAIPRLLRRAALNLATNAARHARQRVRLACAREAGWVHLRVDDDGPGIPPEARERIFEPFFRLDESRSADSGGLGLGLAIVKRIAALHCGRVRVDDSDLGGARFTLSLPAASSS